MTETVYPPLPVASAPANSTPATEPVRRPLWRRLAVGFGYLLAWLAVLACTTAVLLRIFFHDATLELIWLNSFTLYVYLPAYAALAWALWRRSWLLAGWSTALVACHLYWVGGDFLPASLHKQGSLAASSATPAHVRIFYANVSQHNKAFDATFQEVHEAEPDLVVFVESSLYWEEAIAKSPVMQAFEHTLRTNTQGGQTVTIFSHLPLSNSRQKRFKFRMIVSTDVDLGGTKFRLFGLHSPRPIELPWTDFYGFWIFAQAELAQEPEPLVVVGDFNITQHAKIYDELTSGRLRGAHESAGRGYATTWPQQRDEYRLPPIRIDHVLLSPQVECLAIREGLGLGSDHRPLVVDLAVYPLTPRVSEMPSGASN